jgi:hypothetical protein
MSRNSNPALQRLLLLVKEVASGRLPQLVRKEAGKIAVFLLGLQSLTQSLVPIFTSPRESSVRLDEGAAPSPRSSLLGLRRTGPSFLLRQDLRYIACKSR